MAFSTERRLARRGTVSLKELGRGGWTVPLARRPDTRLLAAAAVTLAVDRLTKALALADLPKGRQVWVVDHLLALTRITNRGAAFGLLPRAEWLFVSVAVVVILVLLALPRQKEPWLAMAYGCIVGGAMGNLWDRLTTGAVVDFLDFRYWPGIFNAADVFVVVGVCLVAITLLRNMS